MIKVHATSTGQHSTVYTIHSIPLNHEVICFVISNICIIGH